MEPTPLDKRTFEYLHAGIFSKPDYSDVTDAMKNSGYKVDHDKAYAKLREIVPSVDPTNPRHQQAYVDCLWYVKEGETNFKKTEGWTAAQIMKKIESDKAAQERLFNYVDGKIVRFIEPDVSVDVGISAILEGSVGVGVPLPTFSGFDYNVQGGREQLKAFLVSSTDAKWKKIAEDFKDRPEALLEIASDTELPMERTLPIYADITARTALKGMSEQDRQKIKGDTKEIAKELENTLKTVMKENGKEFVAHVSDSMKETAKHVDDSMKKNLEENSKQMVKKFSNILEVKLREAFKKSGIAERLEIVEDLVSAAKDRIDLIEEGTKKSLQILEGFQKDWDKEKAAKQEEANFTKKMEKFDHANAEIQGVVNAFQFLGQVGQMTGSPAAGQIATFGQNFGKMVQNMIALQALVKAGGAGIFATAGAVFTVGLSFLTLIFSFFGFGGPDPLLVEILSRLKDIDKKLSALIRRVEFGEYKMDVYHIEMLRNFATTFEYLRVIDRAGKQHSNDIQNFRQEVINIAVQAIGLKYDTLALSVENQKVFKVDATLFRETFNELLLTMRRIPALPLLTSSDTALFSNGEINVREIKTRLNRGFQKNVGLLLELSRVAHTLAGRSETYELVGENALALNFPAYYSGVRLFIKYLLNVDNTTAISAYHTIEKAMEHTKKEVDETMTLGDKANSNLLKMAQSCEFIDFLFEGYQRAYDLVKKRLPEDLDGYRRKMFPLRTADKIKEIQLHLEAVDAIKSPSKVWMLGNFLDIKVFDGLQLRENESKGWTPYFYWCPVGVSAPELGVPAIGEQLRCQRRSHGHKHQDDKLAEFVNRKKEDIKKEFEVHASTYRKMEGTSVYDKIKDDFSPNDSKEKLVPYSLILYPDEKNHQLHQLSMPMLTQNFAQPYAYFIMAEYLRLGTIRHEYTTAENLSLKIYFIVGNDSFAKQYFSQDVCNKYNVTGLCIPNAKILISHQPTNNHVAIVLDKDLRRTWPGHPRLIAEDYPSVLAVWPFRAYYTDSLSSEIRSKQIHFIEEIVKKVEASILQSYYRDVFVYAGAERDQQLLDAIERMDVFAQLIRAHTSLVLAQNPTAQFFLDQEKYLWDKADLYEMAVRKGLYPSKIALEMDGNFKELENHRKCFAEVACGNVTEQKCSSGVEKPIIGNPLLNMTLLVLRNFRTMLENSTITVGDPEAAKAEKGKTAPGSGYVCNDDNICTPTSEEDEFENREEMKQETGYSKPASSSASRNAPFFYLSIIWLRALHDSTVSYLSQPSNLISPEVDQIKSIGEDVESMSTALAIPTMQIPTTEHHEFVMDMMSSEGKLLYNGGSCAFTPQFDQFTRGYIFTCVAYLDKRPVGYVKLFNEPQLCFSEDKTRNNIMEVGGIFRHAYLNSDTAPVCSALPLTFYDRSCSAIKLGALQGSMRGVSDVVESGLVHAGHSAQKAWLISNGIYYGATFTFNFAVYQTQQDSVTAGTMALKDVAILAATSLATSTASRGLYWAASMLAEKGWKAGSAVVSFTAKTVSYLPFAYQTYQDPTIAPISIATGVVSQKATVSGVSLIGKVFGIFSSRSRIVSSVSSGVEQRAAIRQAK